MADGLMLVLMRHAKSDWIDASLSDKERPLNARGKDAAVKVGQWLQKADHTPQHALVSGAQRTRETWQLVGDNFPSATVTFDDTLYLANAFTIISRLQQQSATEVIVIAHNPGIAHLAAQRASHAPTHPKFGQFPTAATLVLKFQCESWRDVYPGTGQTLNFIVPRDLN